MATTVIVVWFAGHTYKITISGIPILLNCAFFLWYVRNLQNWPLAAWHNLADRALNDPALRDTASGSHGWTLETARI